MIYATLAEISGVKGMHITCAHRVGDLPSVNVRPEIDSRITVADGIHSRRGAQTHTEKARRAGPGYA